MLLTGGGSMTISNPTWVGGVGWLVGWLLDIENSSLITLRSEIG